MDTYGSDSLHFSNIDEPHHHHNYHLPLPHNPSFSNDPNLFFNSVPNDVAAELEWLSQIVDEDATSFQDLAEATASIGSNTTSFHSTNNNNQSTDPKSSSSSSSSSALAGKSRARKEVPVAGDEGVRRCSHCASEKTPQWRTGPLGPKTLCNACGVRFKSGRLVPEYRPAASPTFVLTQHSNSHRKVMELRRQKELLRHQQQQQQDQCYHHTQNFQVC